MSVRPGYQPLDGRVRAVVIVFAFVIAVGVAAIVSEILDIKLMDRLIAGEELPDSEYDASDTRADVVFGVGWAAYVAGAIAFIAWLYRAYRNVDVVAPNERRRAHGWAIGGWFVPILAFWRPLQVVNDVWRAGGPPRTTTLPGLWWAAWVLNFVLHWFARSSYSEASPEAYKESMYAAAVADTCYVVAAVLAIVVVVAASRRLNRRAAEPLHRAPAVSRLFESSSDAPTEAPSTATITASETPTGRWPTMSSTSIFPPTKTSSAPSP